jgi:hypothetical protein
MDMEIPDITTLKLYQEEKGYLGLDTGHPLGHGYYYEGDIGGVDSTVNYYTFNNQKLFIAWGPRGTCNHHALLFTDSPVIGEGCINFTLKDNEIVFNEGERTYTYHIV